MLEWFEGLPNWLQQFWFIYVTFHDLVQWLIITAFGLTAWGQRKQKKQLEKLVEHIHQELHMHIQEDASLHKELGQSGITEGK